MAAPFVVEGATPGTQVWGVDASGNTVQSGNQMVAGNVTVVGTLTAPNQTAQTATITGILVANGGYNSAGGINVLSGTIGAGGNAILGTAASGTALSDLTRDYMVYIAVTAAGAAATLTIGPANTAVNTLYAAATCNVGTQYAFRLPAGWYIRFQGTAGITQQIAISC